jgi:hypothetical protein
MRLNRSRRECSVANLFGRIRRHGIRIGIGRSINTGFRAMLHDANEQRECQHCCVLGHRNSADKPSEAEFSPAIPSRTMQELDEHIIAEYQTERSLVWKRAKP